MTDPVTPQTVEPVLQGVHIQITVGPDHDDGVDSDSKVDFKLLLNNSATAASYHLGQTFVGGGDNFQRDLDIAIPIKKTEVNQCTFYLEINANGHDHFQGDLTVTFAFSDSSRGYFPYGSFGIGTHNESNSTRKQVNMLPSR